MNHTTETFSSRWVMILAMLGMAVGAGNIWRFPRIAAQNGGGEFLVAWITFLFMWSIPLILVEFGMGRRTRSGPVKAFMHMMGPRWAWMGAFVAFVAVAIMCYYSVVAGWMFRYVLASATGQVGGGAPGAFWTEYLASAWPVLWHGVAMGLGAIVVARGVRAIEQVARILMPALLLLVVVLTVRAVTLPGAGDGLAYLFTVDWAALGQPRIWVEALTQNAWDTGAGWGLVLTYAAYMRHREDTTLNAFLVPAANNTISLFAGVMVICTVFAVVPGLVQQFAGDPSALAGYPSLAAALETGEALTPQLVQSTIFGAGNEGLTFIWMPQLFATLPFGRGLMVLFFLALSFAAFTSLMAMIELGTRVCIDAGIPRHRAIRIVGVGGFLVGLPAALFHPFLQNQDWVWGMALMVSGLFFAAAVVTSGVKRFRAEQLNHEDSDVRVGRWWEWVVTFLVPLQAVVLFVWLLVDAAQGAPAEWLHPLSTYNVGTVVFQLVLVLGILLGLNRWIASRAAVAPDAG